MFNGGINFAKTDVQPLINEGAAKEDIEASVSLAVEVIKSLTEETINTILRK